MLFRKLYLKIRLFLYSVRHMLNTIFLSLMAAVLIYMLVNSFVFGRVIINQANNDQLSGKYENAINLYNISYAYYSLFHSSDDDREIYFSIPYKRAYCYLKLKDKKKSVQSMLEGLTTVQKQYGIFSKQTAYFMRKYLIEYYLDNNNILLATDEFNHLVIIYKKIGYSESEMADLIRISGDLYYQQKKYDIAMDFYKKAYDILVKEKNIDYATFAKTVIRIANYEMQNNKDDVAINIYKTSIESLKAAGPKQNATTADMLIQFGDIYAKQENQVKNAIQCYEDAIEIIKKLPHNNYLKQNIEIYLNTLKDLYNQNGQFHKVDDINVEISRHQRFSFIY